jgi:hypothetical protein
MEGHYQLHRSLILGIAEGQICILAEYTEIVKISDSTILGITALSITALSIMVISIMTLNITTLRIMKLGIMGSFATLKNNNTQY